MQTFESHKLVLVDPRNNVLLMQRQFGAGFNAAGVDFPGGKPETHDESPLATAIRETFEETGILVSPLQCTEHPIAEADYQDGGSRYIKTAWLAMVEFLPSQSRVIAGHEHIGSVVMQASEAATVVRQPFQVDALVAAQLFA